MIDGFRYFGYEPAEGSDSADMAREHTRVFLEVLGDGGPAQPAADVPEPAGPAPGRAALAGAARPHLVGRRNPQDGRVGRGAGHEPDELDAAHRGHRGAVPPAPGRTDRTVPAAWKAAGHAREPRVSVSRSIFPVVNDVDHAYFGREAGSRDQVGQLEGGAARFGKTYAGEPERLVKDLPRTRRSRRPTLLLTIPNQLGVDYNAHLLDSVLRHGARPRVALRRARNDSTAPHSGCRGGAVRE